MPKTLHLLLMVVIVMPSAFAHAAVKLYVAPNGNDQWSGSSALPDGASRDGPLATLGGARDHLRALRREGQLPAGPVEIQVAPGVYELRETFALGSEDSGRGGPVVYRAAKQGTATLSGARAVGQFEPVTDPGALARLPEKARGHVLVADLPAQGISDYGKLVPRGFGLNAPAALELAFEGKVMPVAGWPNRGFEAIAGVSKECDPSVTSFTYSGDRPSRWLSAPDAWVYGCWGYGWADAYLPVAAIDTDNREITVGPPHSNYGFAKGRGWRALNLLEELDMPGEWYLDRASGRLYFWPPKPLSPGSVSVSQLEGPLVALTDAHEVQLEGFRFEGGRTTGVEIHGGEHNLIAGCVVRGVGRDGIVIRGGRENGVQSCDITDTGEGGIILDGGDRATLTPGGHFADNNHIHHWSRWCRTYRPAVAVSGVGNRVTHNRINEGPHSGIIVFTGNDNLFEFNEISRVGLQTEDFGAFMIGSDWTERGNTVRYNFIHHIGRERNGEFSWAEGVYLDNMGCGTIVEGNVFYHFSRAVQLNGGQDNVVVNNVMVDCNTGVVVTSLGVYAYLRGDIDPESFYKGLRAVPYDRPPWSVRYPGLVKLAASKPPWPPLGNVIDRNVITGAKEPLVIGLHESLSQDLVQPHDNFIQGDPRFVDPAKMNFQLRDDSPVWATGFQRIPFEKIGLYRDQWRTKMAPRPWQTM